MATETERPQRLPQRSPRRTGAGPAGTETATGSSPLPRRSAPAKTRAASITRCCAEPPPGHVPAGRAIGYRVTGFWRWKTVVVPPNVYVVHTRRGHPEPVTLGLGTSFRFDPATDAFLLIPASMQTIVINAKCITSVRQGVLVQAYVQWIIDDLATAYRRLDFSDSDRPDAHRQRAAARAGGGGHQGQGRHHDHRPGPQRQAADHRGADAAAATAGRGHLDRPATCRGWG